MKKLKMAVAGLGRIGLSGHLKEAYEHGNFKVVACMDKSHERLMEAKSLYPLAVYDDFEKMIREESLDLVVIASPTSFHCEQSLYALDKVVDVFLEKPMTVNLTEAYKVTEAATMLNRKIMLNQPHRLSASTLALKEGLSLSLIGDVFRVNYHISNFTVRNDWQALKKHGGGMLYNYGAHFIDLFLYLFSPAVTKLYCKTDRILSVGDAEDVVKIILETRENITFDLDINMASTIKKPKWEIYGSRGVIIVEDSFMMIRHLVDEQALQLTLQQSMAADNRKYDNTGILKWHEKIFPLSDYHDIACYDTVYAYFALNQTPVVPVSDSIKVMELLHQCANQ